MKPVALDFTYMGTKRQIAQHVAEVISLGPPGILLEAFAGMSAVGNAVAPRRPLWCNDIQRFACTVAGAFFTSQSPPKVSKHAVQMCQTLFQRNKEALGSIFGQRLEQEQHAYASGEIDAIRNLSETFVAASESRSCIAKRSYWRRTPNHFPYCLFSVTYAGGYLGLQQAIDIDSLRFALDSLARRGDTTRETSRWMLLALCQAMGRISNSTGHFAQYLSVKPHTKQRFLAKRRRSVWHEWQRALDGMLPVGTKEWRLTNRVFQSESIQLIRRMARHKCQPAVVYCDPHYTADHYSRYIRPSMPTRE